MWRDTGLEDELRRVRREIETKVPRQVDYDVRPQLDAAAADPARGGGGRVMRLPRPWVIPTTTSSRSPDADRREAYSFEPVDEAIAVGDDHAAPGEEPLGFVEDPGHAPAMEADPEADAPDEDGLRAS